MRVMVADDHPVVRDALARTVLNAEPGAELAAAADRDEVESGLAAQPCDLALLDLNMPGMDGAAGIARLRARHPRVRLAVASGQDDADTMRAVLDAGAVAFLSKRETPDTLVQALRLVLSGGVYVPPRALAALAARRAAQRAEPQAAALTPRQRDVLRLLVTGDPNKVIARKLALTEGTVKIHVAAILRALCARNRTEAVVTARRLELA